MLDLSNNSNKIVKFGRGNECLGCNTTSINPPLRGVDVLRCCCIKSIMREEYEELDEEGENDVVDETSMTSNNKKKKLIVVTSIASLLLVLCIAIGISVAPKQSHSTATNNHHKDKFTSTNDIIKVDNDKYLKW